jgi:serine/threonine protein kinase
VKWQQGNILQERYCLLQRLGSYGNRQTWLGFDAQSGKQVTLKALLFAPDERLWQEQRLIEREAQTLASISHPAIPRFCEQFDFTEREGTYTCLALEYIPGVSLAQVVQQEGPFSMEQTRKLAVQVLAVLEILHSLAPPVVHRDLKPDNLILREEDGQICLVDFGSVQAQFGEGRTLTVVGTYGYMAPEQFTGLSSPASDLYGLGATVLFALSGQDPADWPRRGPYIDVRIVPDENLRIWLAKMLDPDPRCRFTDAKCALASLLQPGTLGTDLDIPHLSDSRLRISLSSDHSQMEIKSTNVSGILKSSGWLAAMIGFSAIAAFCLALSELTSPKLVSLLVTIAVPVLLLGIVVLAVGFRNLPWQWRLVADLKGKLLLRTLFGKVIQRYTLPTSLQVATAEEEISGKKPSKFSVALVTPEGRRYSLGNWYNKLESQQLADFLREWLEKNH